MSLDVDGLGDPDTIPEEFLRDIFVEIAEKAVNGTLSDQERVMLMRLGFSIAANEFHRIEREHGEEGDPAVNAKVLLILRQIGLLTQGGEVQLSKLVNPVTGERFELEGEDGDEEPLVE